MIKALPIARSLPLEVGVIHFIGIGGIGMSGIAEILHNLGYKVQGSDASESYNTKRLEKLGIKIFVGHKASQVDEASVVVVSSAIKTDNPEVVAARAQRLPVVRRAEMLAELMRLKISIAIAGTHGKTTTTALMGAMLETADFQPTVINGGILNAHGTNAYLGKGDWMVVEADESDGSFTKLPASIAIVTNIDPEHLDHYGSFDKAKEAYATFLTNLPFYGFAALCTDHPEVQALAAKVQDRRIITYGTNKQADIQVSNIRTMPDGEHFTVTVAHAGEKPRVLENVHLAMHGHHNILNALGAFAVALELEIEDATILKALSDFKGVKRRFTKVGEAHGVTVIDDYGHHPVEIAATLKAARDAQQHVQGRVIAVVQPHRYTRLRDLFDDFCTAFNDADIVLVSDVYPAGEAPIEGIDAHHLIDGLRGAGHKQVLHMESPATLATEVLSVAQPGDMVVCLGAGSITSWAHALPDQLAAMDGKKAMKK